jgi:hypothetical protein
MQTSKSAVLIPASYLSDPSLHPPFTTRYAIRTPQGGFLAARTGTSGIPVEEVFDPFDAVRFADMDTAAQRARALLKLGWSDLRVVALHAPLF